MAEEKNEVIKEDNMSAKIKVVGIGGGGSNAVNTMIKSGLSGVEYIVANTDAQALNASLATVKVQLGAEITKGLGAGANPEVGRNAALEEYEKLSEVLEGADMVFVTAGMGGGTGTGAAPVIAKLSRELGALTVGVVTKPFLFEGKRRFRQAESGIESLASCVDSLITIPNQRLLLLAGESLSLVDTFKKADEILLHAVQGISDLINNTGLINADFADVSTVMANKGLALMGTGICSGPDRAIKAASDAISSPLLEDVTIEGATGIIINITGDDSLTTHETNEAVSLIMEAADDDAEIIFGTVIDENMGENVKITVIATGLGGDEEEKQHIINESVELDQNSLESAQVLATPERPSISLSEQENENVTNSHEDSKDFNWKEGALLEEDEGSHLISSIKKAASEFETNVRPSAPVEKSIPAASSESYDQEVTAQKRPPERPAMSQEEARKENSPGRAKMIAEKLGFINFDEDEFDSPSYLKKGNKANSDNNRIDI